MAKKLEWLDYFERPISPGQFVAYGARSGNSGVISVGKVLNCVIADSYGEKIPKLKVARYERAYSGAGRLFKSTLASFSQLIIISRDSLPESVTEALDAQH